MVVKEFNRIFDRDHVFFTLAVDLVQHGRERGRFPGARWSRDQDKSARLITKPLYYGGQAQGLKSLDVPWNGTEHGADRPALIEAISAEASEVLQAEGKVQFQVFLEAVLLRIGQHAIGQRLGICGSQRWHVQRPELPVHAHPGSAISGDMEV